MTETVPETDDLIAKLKSQIGDDVQQIYDHEALFKQSITALEAAQARIAELEATIADNVWIAELNDKLDRVDLVSAARREALEEAAKVAKNVMTKYAELTYDPNHDKMQNAAKTYCAGEIEAAIRALMEKPNENG